VDELLRADAGEQDGVTDELLEMLAQEVAEVRDQNNKLEHEMKILRGAMEETIAQLRDVQAHFRAPKVEQEQAVGDTQQAARLGMTPKGHRSKAKAFRGVYCRNCAKELKGKNQGIFCSRKCAARWRSKHPNQVATPRLSIKDDYQATVVAGEGVKAGSVTA